MYQRHLSDTDALRVEQLTRQLQQALSTENLGDANRFANDILTIRTWSQGQGHWSTIDARADVANVRQLKSWNRQQRTDWQASVQAYAAGDKLYLRQEFTAARGEFEKTLALRSKLLPETHPDVARCHWQIGSCLTWEGKFAEAESRLNSAAAHLTKALGEFHPDSALCLSSLAFCLQRAGKLAAAVDAYERQLRVRREIDGPAHLHTGMAELSLAYAYESGSRFDLAEPHLRRALQIYEVVHGNQSAEVAERHRHLGNILDELNKFAEAETHYLKALAIARQVDGENGPRAIGALRDLAGHYRWVFDFSKAVDTCQAVLALQQTVTPLVPLDLARSQTDLGEALISAKRYVSARPHLEAALQIRRNELGETHPDTGRVATLLGNTLHRSGQYEPAQDSYSIALKAELPDSTSGLRWRVSLLHDSATNLDSLGRRANAEQTLRQAVEFSHAKLGEGNADTLFSNQLLLESLRQQRKHDEAERLTNQIKEQLLGASTLDDLTRASACGTLSLSLRQQGRFDEALPFDKEAVRLWSKLRGEDHPNTRGALIGWASCLSGQGRFSEAASVELNYLERAVTNHGAVSTQAFDAYGFAMANMMSLGDWRRADQFAQERVYIAEQLAANSDAYFEAIWSRAVQLGKLGDRDAEISIYQQVVPHFESQVKQSAGSFDRGQLLRLATVLSRLDRHDEAIQRARQALAAQEDEYGRDSASSMDTRVALAMILQASDRITDAEAQWRRVVEIARDRRGANNPTTVRYLSELGFNLHIQGKPDEAEVVWQQAADGYRAGQARIAPSGLARSSAASQFLRRDLLAVLQAKRGAVGPATQRLEQHLGRGLLDELFVRRTRTLNQQDQLRQSDLSEEIRELEQQQSELASIEITENNRDDVQTLRSRLDRDAIRIDREWKQFQAELTERYGSTVTEVYSIERIQRQLRYDEALVAWIDQWPNADGRPGVAEHWACVIRSQGSPAWVPLPGTGQGGAWTGDDADLLTQFQQQVSKAAPRFADQRSVAAMADEVDQQRLKPLEAALAARGELPRVAHLFALSSSTVNAVPWSAVTQQYTISRVPSGTILALLRENDSQPTLEPRLLAIGNPRFVTPTVVATDDRTPPESGVLVQKVEARSNANDAGVRPDDILLQYADVKLETGQHLLQAIQASAPPQGQPVTEASIPLTIWRDGETADLRLRPGSMGIAFSQLPARTAWLAQRRARRVVREARGNDGLAPLPATGIEMENIWATFKRHGFDGRVLQQAEANEAQITALVKSDALRNYSYLHFATHAVMNEHAPMESFLVFTSQPSSGTGLDALLSGKEDGHITAGVVLRDWRLDADLVVLSACQTGLGREMAGEGIIGFGSAFLLAGSRAVLVTLWPVDDTATALLMDRFYHNLLDARRPGKTIDKARALADAQRWLRELTHDEAELIIAGLEDAQIPAHPHPFAHPSYWSAFTLIGISR